MTEQDPRDREVRDYVESRMRHEVPPDLIDAIQHDVDRTPQRGRGWGIWPAAGAVAVAAAAVLLAVVVATRPPNVGIDGTPSPSPSPTVQPSASPSESPLPTGDPSPSPSASADGPSGPIHSMSPEEAFAIPDECENPVAGYRISMPDDWYYNTAFDDFDACQWFAPTTFEVTDSSSVPPEVAIVIRVHDADTDHALAGEVVSREEFTVAGLPAYRLEQVAAPGGFTFEDMVEWVIGLDGTLPGGASDHGRWLSVTTDTSHEDFAANVDILDRMIATLVVEP